MASHERIIFNHIHQHFKADSALKQRFLHAREVTRHFRLPAFYEVTAKCNLLCEGCYYFEGGYNDSIREEEDVNAWEAFFRREAERGVSMAYFVGAEPALKQERLAAAARHLKTGQVGANGTIRIDPEIPYRIVLSIWAGDEKTDKELRGGAVFRKAIQNYAGDWRAIALYTITRSNISGIRSVARLCEDNGLQLTFNLYSPTSRYLDKLHQHAQPDKKFFRISTNDNNLVFDDASLLAVRRAVEDAMLEFPETIVYSNAYNHWMTEPDSRFEVDPVTGVAKDCRSRVVGDFKYFTTDLNQAEVKCCTSSIDCNQCRMYSAGWSTRLEPKLSDVETRAAFVDWLGMIETIGRISFCGMKWDHRS